MPVEPSTVLLDQNVPYETTEWLRSVLSESTIYHVYDLSLDGWSDEQLFRFAQDRGMLIVSYDEDFADRRLFPLGTHFGIVRLRVEPTTFEETAAALERLFSTYRPDELRGKLAIIQANRIRIVEE